MAWRHSAISKAVRLHSVRTVPRWHSALNLLDGRPLCWLLLLLLFLLLLLEMMLCPPIHILLQRRWQRIQRVAASILHHHRRGHRAAGFLVKYGISVVVQRVR